MSRVLDCFDGLLHCIARFGYGVRLSSPVEDIRAKTRYLWHLGLTNRILIQRMTLVRSEMTLPCIGGNPLGAKGMTKEVKMELTEHIDDIRNRLKSEEYPNERAVRQCIIDRLLLNLGWPTYAPRIVYPEYSIAGGGIVDYVLYDPKTENPRVLIEAKQVDNIAGAEVELFDYVSHINVPIAILTDGRQWFFFHPTGKGKWKEHKMYLDLSTEDSEENAERLERYLGYEAVCTGEANKMIKEDYDNLVIEKEIESHFPDAWGNVIEKENKLLTELIAKEIIELCGHRPTNEQVLDYLKSLKKIEPPIESSSRKKGGSMRVIMDDGTIIHHNVVADTFIATIERLGIENVLKLGLGGDKHPLIKRKDPDDPAGKDRKSNPSGYYSVYTVADTPRKKDLLRQIANRLGRQIEVE